jgi:hypothetical protein
MTTFSQSSSYFGTCYRRTNPIWWAHKVPLVIEIIIVVIGLEPIPTSNTPLLCMLCLECNNLVNPCFFERERVYHHESREAMVWFWRKEIVWRVSPYESFIVFFSFACLFVWSKVEKVLACTYKWLRKILQFVSQLWVGMSFSNRLSKVQLNMRLPLHVELPLNPLYVSLLLLHGQSIYSYS